MEYYPWDEFFPDHCSVAFMKLMEEEGVLLKVSGTVDSSDLADAFYELDDYEYQKKLLNILISQGVTITYEMISDIFDAIGSDGIFLDLLSHVSGPVSRKTIEYFIDYGEDEILNKLIPLYDGTLSPQHIAEMANAGVSDDAIRKMIHKNDTPYNAEQLEDLFGCCSDDLYPEIEKHMKNLSFRDKVRLRDDYLGW